MIKILKDNLYLNILTGEKYTSKKFGKYEYIKVADKKKTYGYNLIRLDLIQYDRIN